ncbi:hypothetical protein B0O99DRAFT_744349 [Bisporella sp. PMI_857]|nr:hypothetical protein B0O99DRAFT_744349 [Bisporella sp. PMI_857]
MIAESTRSGSISGGMGTLSPGSIGNNRELRKTSWLLAISNLKEALKRASPVSGAKASRKHTFQSLEQAINSTKLDGSSSCKLNAQSDILPFLRILETTADMLLKTMAPSKTALYFFLGALQCTIEMTQQYLKNWQSFVDLLREARQKLEKLEAVMKRLREDPDDSSRYNLLGDTISAVFLILLELFVDILSTMRRNPFGVFDDNWTKTRENAMKRMGKDIFHFSEMVNQAELRNSTRVSAQPDQSSSTENGVTFPLKVLPWPAYNGFFGREEVLAELAEKLGLENFNQRGSGDVQSVLLHGTGGVGKTQISRAFAHRNTVGFDAIFWVRSDTEVNIMADSTRIALSLNLPGASADSQTGSWFIVTRWLHEQESSPKGKRCLIIYDNCDDINDIYPKYIPTTKCSVLITSRHNSAKLADSSILQVLPFDRLSGLKLMKRLLYHGKEGEDKILSSSEDKALQELLEKVDRLPLGIHVMVALMIPRMNEKRRHPIRDFSKFYEEHSRQLLIRAPRRMDYDRDLDRAVGEKHILDNIWHLSFTSLDEKALSVLGMLAFFAPNDISISWFDLGSKEIPPTHKVLSVCRSLFEIECAIIDLQGAALISKDIDESVTDSDSGASSNIIMTPSTDSICAESEEDFGDFNSDSDLGENSSDTGINSAKVSLHRLVQEAVIYSRKPADCQAISDAAIRVMYEAFPKQEGGMTMESQVETCSRLTPHILSLVRRHQELGHGTSNPVVPSGELIHLLKHCIWYLYETGDDTTALQLLEFVYGAIDRVGMDKTSEFYADLQYKAGSVYMNWGYLTKCRQVWEEARHILEGKRAAGSESAKQQLTWLLMAMGNLETADGNYETALLLFIQSDEERLKDDKDNMWRHAISNMNLGRLYSIMGDYGKAMQNYKECKKGFLPQSPSMAIVEYACGDVEFARGNHVRAREHYLEAVRSFQASGTNPATLASCYTKLARVGLLESNPQLALKYIQRARQLAKLHAHSQGDQARILHITSTIQRVLGKDAEAEASARLAEQQRLKLKAILESGGQVEKAVWDGSESRWDELVCFFWR